jgi:predicted nucleic acid-binding protein
VSKPPLAPYLDPRAGEVTFDSSTLINIDSAPEFRDLIMRKFSGRTHLAAEVLAELDRGLTGPNVRTQPPWFVEEAVIGPPLLSRMSTFMLRCDLGEAATLTLAQARSWTVVIDDGAGYRLAVDEHIRVTRTPQLLVSTVRAGWCSSRQAWEAYRAMIQVRGQRPGPIPWAGWEQFDALCHTYTWD